ncbi:hypothetical protein [Streptomyces sp. NPDC059862]|uniref:hypothetical protein n=1 Tax=unclassified Streptomyces TaxID=2593676 RepID=UPI003634A81E
MTMRETERKYKVVAAGQKGHGEPLSSEKKAHRSPAGTVPMAWFREPDAVGRAAVSRA